MDSLINRDAFYPTPKGIIDNPYLMGLERLQASNNELIQSVSAGLDTIESKAIELDKIEAKTAKLLNEIKIQYKENTKSINQIINDLSINSSDIYVDQAHGDDKNIGRISSPKKTIESALSVATANARIGILHDYIIDSTIQLNNFKKIIFFTPEKDYPNKERPKLIANTRLNKNNNPIINCFNINTCSLIVFEKIGIFTHDIDVKTDCELGHDAFITLDKEYPFNSICLIRDSKTRIGSNTLFADVGIKSIDTAANIIFERGHIISHNSVIAQGCKPQFKNTDVTDI